MELDNCPKCGKLFAKNFREICPACIKEVDAQYMICADYLRKNRGSTIHELSEATEVSVPQITKFIREGRISLIGAPNLGYPCEVCGTLIRENNMCANCRARLLQDVNKNKGKLSKESESAPTSSMASYRIKDSLRDRN
ncbi:TIGR03826 family flagellar region protein [Paenibacillus spongiae]|uniref:Flagellar protein n=1 Tax=Paenibacillus spongiae TaxID=2909671 RepID=A0ABY5S8I7_9BACL|nr:TIGR03826 family flagellar region protein [Paenibacillus spongiae]UVI29900.1 flagellar protein [Paenibacillus spongiae]